MHRYRNIAISGVAGLILFALGISGIQASGEDSEAWLSEYNAAMQSNTPD